MRDLLEPNLLPVRWYDVDTDEESAVLLDVLNIPRNETPVLVRNDGVLRNPSPAQVARELGLRAEVDGERFELVVLGGGPAGLASAVYGASRACAPSSPRRGHAAASRAPALVPRRPHRGGPQRRATDADGGQRRAWR